MALRAPYLMPALAAPMAAPLAARLAIALTNPVAAFLVNGAAKALTSPSLSNTVEQIRLVYGLTRIVRLVRPVQIVKQCFTGRTGRGRMVTCISLEHSTSTSTRPVRPVQLVRVVKQWPTSRTVVELHTFYILIKSNTVEHIRP